MRRISQALCLALFAGLASAAPTLPHHDLQVSLDPAAGRIHVTDRLHLPAALGRSVDLRLGAAFTLHSDDAQLERLDAPRGGQFRHYRLQLPAATRSVSLRYSGRIMAAPRSAEHGMPRAVLDADGAYLDGASGWVAWIGDTPATFSLSVALPADWQAISQGRRSADGRRWQADTPQDDIYLLAGRFTRSARAHGEITLDTWLLDDDPALAERYLAVMGQYLDFYSALIGPYPYPRFAVVENRWQTGYGMPSFTLLGSRVLRLPFILHSALPHEILHNWWGNGVWVDARAGNWSEGLTAYLADHLIQEAQGGGAEYRRKLLERYTSFAADGRDLALRDFRSRHSDATQAVGYGKALMLFHMLRRQIGDAAFVAGLRTLWQRHRFSAAGFDEVAAALQSTASGDALDPRWRDTPGAPQLVIAGLDVQPTADGHRLRLTLRQSQPGAPYPLNVPVAVQLDGGGVERLLLRLDAREATLTHRFARAPLRVDVDPQFDLFRRLDPGEQPPSLARLFGAPTQWLILPAAAPAAERAAWQALADQWQQRFGNVRVLTDAQLDRLPDTAAAWVLGTHNRALATLRGRFNAGAQGLDAAAARLAGAHYPLADNALVLLDPDNRRPPLGLLAAIDPADIAALARKLPHYSTYGQLVFAAGTLEKRLARALPVAHSPLHRVLGAVDPGPPPAVAPRLIDQVSAPLRFD